jgi:hypothetical protein
MIERVVQFLRQFLGPRMDADATGDDRKSIIVQFRVEGFGTDAEFDRRVQMDELLDRALRRTNNGLCDGGDSGSGSMNLFLYVDDVQRAVATVLETLRKNSLLGGVVVAESLEEGEGDDKEVIGHKVWWPPDFTGEFSIL